MARPAGRVFYLGRKMKSKNGGSMIGTCKQRGEWAELCFMARAAERGFSVSKPHGESVAYDVTVEDNGRFLRVQVKSTTFRRNGSYTCNLVGASRKPYAKGKVDFFAVDLVPIELWYIIPFEAVGEHLCVNLRPRKGYKFAQYIEAWELMRASRSQEE